MGGWQGERERERSSRRDLQCVPERCFVYSPLQSWIDPLSSFLPTPPSLFLSGARRWPGRGRSCCSISFLFFFFTLVTWADGTLLVPQSGLDAQEVEIKTELTEQMRGLTVWARVSLLFTQRRERQRERERERGGGTWLWRTVLSSWHKWVVLRFGFVLICFILKTEICDVCWCLRMRLWIQWCNNYSPVYHELWLNWCLASYELCYNQNGAWKGTCSTLQGNNIQDVVPVHI